jgi:hypothetical protein
MKLSTLVSFVAVLGGLAGCGGKIGSSNANSGAAGSSGASGSGSGPTAGTTGAAGVGSGGTSSPTGAGASGVAGTTGAAGTGYATGTAGTTGAGATTGTAGTGGDVTQPLSAFAAVRKVKNILTGLAPTDAEVAAGATPSGLKTLVDTWMATPQFQSKMILFFQNAYQQSSLAVLDYEFQLRKRPGAFDLSYGVFGDNAFPLLFQNLKESFARTCLQLIAEGKPFSDMLTTQRFMMTTALMSLYMQIEMPYDIHTFDWKFNHGTRPAIEDTLNPASANYMVFGYAAPTTSTGKAPSGANCAGDSSKVSTYPGNTNLFHVLLGNVDRDSTNNGQGTSNLGCFEHAIKPYFTSTDLSDWRMVTITNTGTPLRSFDLPGLRAVTTTLSSKLPRVSFFTTPSFLAVWNTNDSNQHRVTANQALLGAIGQGFTNATSAIPTPPSAVAVDGSHAVSGSICYGCHKSLDPMRQFWGNFFDYNDQVGKAGAAASFGFADVTANGTTLVDFGKLVGQVTDSQASPTLNRFALETTQKLCFFANSAQCEETDPEMRRVAQAFQTASYDFKTLVRELMASPLVTGWANTATFTQDGLTISVARRDQLCGALSARLGKADLCEIAVPAPTGVTTAMNRLAGAIPADAFSRGSQFPVTAPDPNLFYRASTELVCEAIAAKVVDATSGTVYTSTSYATAIPDIVQKVMAVPPSDPHSAALVKALTDHYNAAIAAKATATSALRSTFSAACQSPTSLSLGI